MATMNTISKALESMPADIRASNIESLTYIKYLLTVTNTSPKRWNIFKIFGGEDGNQEKLVTARNELNKRFMEQLAIQKAKQVETTAEALSVLPKFMEAIEDGITKSLESRKSELQHQIERNTTYIVRQYNEIDRYMKSNADLTREQMRLSGDNPTAHIKDELEGVLKEGYWTNPVVDGEYIYLNTQEEIILTQKNKAANINIELNVGKLAVKIHMASFRMLVIPYKSNIGVSGTSYGTIYHPHVSGEGNICWGDAGPNVAQWQASMNLGKILKMLYSLLFTYSDSAPYCTLQRMKHDGRRKGRTSEELRHPERTAEYKAKLKAEREAENVAESSPEIQAPAEEVTY